MLTKIPQAMLNQAVDLSESGKVLKIIVSSRFVTMPDLYAQADEVATNGAVVVINECFSNDGNGRGTLRYREMQILNIPCLMCLSEPPAWWSRRSEAKLTS